jgi:hypothetical protein
MNKYYIAEKVNENEFTAFNKARDDIERIFSEVGYKKLHIYANIVRSKVSILRFIWELLLSLIKIKSKDFIYFQYPYYKNNRKIYYLLKLIKRIKKPTIVAIIHDIDSLRFKENHGRMNEEIKILKHFDYIISHNESMTKWLRQKGIKEKIININLFDYLLDDTSKSNNTRETDIVFAGNLEKKKSGFVYKIINNEKINYTINLYGPNFISEIKNKNIEYMGKYSPEELIKNLEGKFGLIWDGESIESCIGEIGEYTKYNNPHKLSMYIAAGLPIICWSKMAIAEFVIENGIGIVISNISEIGKEIKNIDYSNYKEMLTKIEELKIKVSKGLFTREALNKIN